MENKIECGHCEETFNSEDTLRQHSNAKHGKFIINEKRNVARKPILKYILVEGVRMYGYKRELLIRVGVAK